LSYSPISRVVVPGQRHQPDRITPDGNTGWPVMRMSGMARRNSTRLRSM
jgi:hypothetical protein